MTTEYQVLLLPDYLSFELPLQRLAFFAFPNVACEFVLSFVAFVLVRPETFEILRKKNK